MTTMPLVSLAHLSSFTVRWHVIYGGGILLCMGTGWWWSWEFPFTTVLEFLQCRLWPLDEPKRRDAVSEFFYGDVVVSMWAKAFGI